MGENKIKVHRKFRTVRFLVGTTFKSPPKNSVLASKDSKVEGHWLQEVETSRSKNFKQRRITMLALHTDHRPLMWKEKARDSAAPMLVGIQNEKRPSKASVFPVSKLR